MSAASPENKHQELLNLLLPLIDFMDKNNFHYFLIAGKDGVCSRYLEGKPTELLSMITSMAEKHPQFKTILNLAVNEINETKN